MEELYYNSGSNNTNKLSPQEQKPLSLFKDFVQIIQINLVLKNAPPISNLVASFK